MKVLTLFMLIFLAACSEKEQAKQEKLPDQFITVLGIAQDAGFPQANCEKEQCRLYWEGREKKRNVASLGLTDRSTGQSWMFEATPDFPQQLHQLKKTTGLQTLSGIFLTHAHIGHYTGLMHLGREAMGASEVPVFTMPRMKSFLEENGPWSQLITLQNISLHQLMADSTFRLTEHLSVTPFLVPHRDEFSETVGYKIESQDKKVLFIPDINKWHIWDRDIIEEISKVDLAFLDGTFYDQHELPNRNMSEIPHPYIEESLELFKNLPVSEKKKIIFIHFNHTNPLVLNSPERTKVESLGFNVAYEGQIISLN